MHQFSEELKAWGAPASLPRQPEDLETLAARLLVATLPARRAEGQVRQTIESAQDAEPRVSMLLTPVRNAITSAGLGTGNPVPADGIQHFIDAGRSFVEHRVWTGGVCVIGSLCGAQRRWWAGCFLEVTDDQLLRMTAAHLFGEQQPTHAFWTDTRIADLGSALEQHELAELMDALIQQAPAAMQQFLT